MPKPKADVSLVYNIIYFSMKESSNFVRNSEGEDNLNLVNLNSPRQKPRDFVTGNNNLNFFKDHYNTCTQEEGLRSTSHAHKSRLHICKNTHITRSFCIACLHMFVNS